MDKPAQQREPLTPREREVIALIAKGLLAEGIAAELGIAVKTARRHIYRASVKLGVSHGDNTRVFVLLAAYGSTGDMRGVVELVRRTRYVAPEATASRCRAIAAGHRASECRRSSPPRIER
jgi:DNA-binding NarL/FixJ family response regulator